MVDTYGQLQKAYDALHPARRAEYDAKGSTREGSSEKKYAEGFVGTGAGGKTMNIVNQGRTHARAARPASPQAGYNMSHSSGFDAWLRNQKGLGKTGFYTAEDLLRSKRGGIEATDEYSTPLPPLSTTAVCYDKHGPPEQVLYVDKARALPEKLAHGEVLVHMLAACVNDEDLLRVQT